MNESHYPIPPAFLEKIVAIINSSQVKEAFMPANDPMAAALGAPPPGGMGAPMGGPMGGPMGAPPPPPPPGGGGMPPMDLGSLLGLGGMPPMDMGMGGAVPPPPPPTPGMPLPTGEEMGGQTGAERGGEEPETTKTIGNMNKEEFGFLLKSNVSSVVEESISDLASVIKELKKDIADIKAALEKSTGLVSEERGEAGPERRML